ncbi:hypothetical protein EJ06DRAFT_560637 [Trichodelitschia bisporula]|uniref:DUF6590 domain-containing protein n=1 Tax=Trichodelitschia bisporula TaxID=703511 RepID=A0A6G1HI71_9PEZI|nr:hypothetical protein EJ06DRAFT_560637 [Trichodelitschia bisporula]
MPPPPPRPPPTHIGGTGGEYEVLDPSYRVYRPGSTFFVPGCVFKILWFEPSGSTQMRRGTSITRDARFGEDVHAKIRWFVVIQEGDENWCRCLPINTYDYRGVAKHGVVKANHSIIFTHTEPDPQPEEYPRPYEQGMRSSIKVIPRDGYGSLHEMSRIHFRKIYTVEHNVKVYHFGNVDPQYMDVLIGHYRDANAV